MKHQLVTYPDDRLRQKTQVVTSAKAVAKLISRLEKVMRASDGVGIAAPQLGVPKQAFLAMDGAKLYVFVNPQITYRSQEATIDMEGCLSFPDRFLPVARSQVIRVAALDANFEPFELEAEGFFARIIQHEYDHLVGRLLIDEAIYEAA